MPFSNDNAVRNSNNPLDADFIIIDESSMVDVELMSLLLSAISDGTRLLFVGDEHQLPSVGAGNCLHDMIASKKFPVYRLTENFRQGGGGTIVDNARRILRGKLPVKATDFSIIKVEDDEDAYNFLCKMMKLYYDVKDPFKCQLIEPSRQGFAGTWKMNQYVHGLVHDNIENLDPSIMVGDKIMFNQNVYVDGFDENGDIIKFEYDKNEKKHKCQTDISKAVPLYVNGEMGIVTYLSNDEVVVNDGVEEKVLSAKSLRDMELAYAYTIHKSQGSEADTIIIYLPESMGHMMTRSLLYTAATRARKQVIIAYSGDALSSCINNTSDIERDTRLLERLVA